MPFTFTGLRKSIANARLMVDYLMEDLKDIQKLIESREELDYQLSRLRMDSQPTNYPAPSRRTHGHSSAVSSREETMKDSVEPQMQGRWMLGKSVGTVWSCPAPPPCSAPLEGGSGAASAAALEGGSGAASAAVRAGGPGQRAAGGVGGQR